MIVFVVFHSGLEDDRDVRAVFSTRERAEEYIAQPPVCEYDEHDHVKVTYLVDKPGFMVIYQPHEMQQDPTDAYGCHMARGHEHCCGVYEYELDARKPMVILEGKSGAGTIINTLAVR